MHEKTILDVYGEMLNQAQRLRERAREGERPDSPLGYDDVAQELHHWLMEMEKTKAINP